MDAMDVPAKTAESSVSMPCPTTMFVIDER